MLYQIVEVLVRNRSIITIDKGLVEKVYKVAQPHNPRIFKRQTNQLIQRKKVNTPKIISFDNKKILTVIFEHKEFIPAADSTLSKDANLYFDELRNNYDNYDWQKFWLDFFHISQSDLSLDLDVPNYGLDKINGEITYFDFSLEYKSDLIYNIGNKSLKLKIGFMKLKNLIRRNLGAAKIHQLSSLSKLEKDLEKAIEKFGVNKAAIKLIKDSKITNL